MNCCLVSLYTLLYVNTLVELLVIVFDDEQFLTFKVIECFLRCDKYLDLTKLKLITKKTKKLELELESLK